MIPSLSLSLSLYIYIYIYIYNNILYCKMYINKINIIPIIIVTFESIDIIKQNYFS